MSSWIGWSTTNLDAVGILLQRLGSLSIGVAVGMNLANYFATATFVCTAITLPLGLALFWLAEHRVKSASRRVT